MDHPRLGRRYGSFDTTALQQYLGSASRRGKGQQGRPRRPNVNRMVRDRTVSSWRIFSQNLKEDGTHMLEDVLLRLQRKVRYIQGLPLAALGPLRMGRCSYCTVISLHSHVSLSSGVQRLQTHDVQGALPYIFLIHFQDRRRTLSSDPLAREGWHGVEKERERKQERQQRRLPTCRLA